MRIYVLVSRGKGINPETRLQALGYLIVFLHTLLFKPHSEVFNGQYVLGIFRDTFEVNLFIFIKRTADVR